MSSTPIGDHALLSDCHSSALVDTSGSVEWLTFPRFDSPAVMAACSTTAPATGPSGPPGGSHIASLPGRHDGARDDDADPVGHGGLTDALAMGPDNKGHALGRDAPHILVRSLGCVAGEVEIEVSYAPRPEYGLVIPVLSQVEGGVRARRRRAAGAHHAGRLGAGRGVAVGRQHSRPARPCASRCTGRPGGNHRRACGRTTRSTCCSSARWWHGGRGRPCTSSTGARGRTWCTPAVGC